MELLRNFVLIYVLSAFNFFHARGNITQIFPFFFHGFKNGDYRAPSLNFFCFTTLNFHKKYYSEEGPYCAFLANDSLRRNREDIQFIFLILACCGLQAKYLYKAHITAHYCTVGRRLPVPIWTKPEVQVLSVMSPWRAHFHICIPRAWVISILASLILWDLGESQILITSDIKTVKSYESFLFLFYIPIYLLLLCYSNNQALWL